MSYTADGSQRDDDGRNGRFEPIDFIKPYPRQLGVLVFAQVSWCTIPLGDKVDTVGTFAVDHRIGFLQNGEQTVLDRDDP